MARSQACLAGQTQQQAPPCGGAPQHIPHNHAVLIFRSAQVCPEKAVARACRRLSAAAILYAGCFHVMHQACSAGSDKHAYVLRKGCGACVPSAHGSGSRCRRCAASRTRRRTLTMQSPGARRWVSYSSSLLQLLWLPANACPIPCRAMEQSNRPSPPASQSAALLQHAVPSHSRRCEGSHAHAPSQGHTKFNSDMIQADSALAALFEGMGGVACSGDRP